VTEELTEELLAMAERLYLRALARGETPVSDYHEKSGVPAGCERGLSAEEIKNWLT
jgi:hypothetical protein